MYKKTIRQIIEENAYFNGKKRTIADMTAFLSGYYKHMTADAGIVLNAIIDAAFDGIIEFGR